MGSSSSKKPDTRTSEDQSSENEYFVDHASDDARVHKDIEKLRKEYRDNPETFLLNQVLFSVNFFQNYDQELTESAPNEVISVKELSLTEDLFLTCLKPDNALSLVNKHVQFCASHGINKGKVSPLVSNRIFVIHENIQVVADAENHYANIDRPSLTAQVVEKQRKGYVRLKYIEDLKFKTSISSNSSSITTSSLSSLDDGSETYGRITKARTIKPMPKMDLKQMKKTLYPISEVKRKNYDEHSEDLYMHEYYVNSKAMMEQFHQNWPNIAELLELDNDEIETGFNCDSIFCRSSTGDITWEIIPAVQLPKGAYEYFLKIKSANIDAQLANNKERVFPNKSMLDQIVHMDRLAIPRGFIPKYRDEVNKNCHLEWELAHPKVEKYLQQHLTHTHVRTLLLMLSLLKTFVEPKSTHQGVTIRHLVIHLFWELQKDVVINDTRMGTRLVQIIDALCTRLGKGYLPDYFVEERNHFENVPTVHIRHALDEFARTRDKPLVNFMTAIRNLKYVDEAIPKLDVKKLYHILTKSMMPVPKSVQRGKAERRDTKLDWEAKKRAKRIKDQRREEREVVENLKPERKVSVDSILEGIIKIVPTEDSEQVKRSREVIVFFLDHYTNMATSLNTLGNLKQALSYLRQAELLTYLFHKSFYEESNKYQEMIRTLRKSLEEVSEKHSISEMEQRRKSHVDLTLPNLPERTPSVCISSTRLINQNMMDLSKVHQQQQNGEVQSKLLRKRRESENKSRSDDSNQDSDNSDVQVTLRHHPKETIRMHRKRQESERSMNSDSSEVVQMSSRKTKSVNFNAKVIFGMDTNSTKVEPKVETPIDPKIIAVNGKQHDTIDNDANTQVTAIKSETSEDSESSDTFTSDEEEEEDLDGLDEIMSDDENTLVQFTNPINHNTNKIYLGYEPEDTFT